MTLPDNHTVTREFDMTEAGEMNMKMEP